jgi:hypothetical protein
MKTAGFPESFYVSVILHGVIHQKTASLTLGLRFGTVFSVPILRMMIISQNMFFILNRFSNSSGLAALVSNLGRLNDKSRRCL